MKNLKIVLSILLLTCLFHLPYGYYQFVRFVATIGFSVLAYSAYSANSKIHPLVYVVLALLFQPFLKIALGRELWNMVDVIVAIFLIATLFEKTRLMKKRH